MNSVHRIEVGICIIHKTPSTRHRPSRLPPRESRVSRLVWLPPSHLIMWRSWVSSASRQPPNHHLNRHGTVDLLPGNKLPKGRLYPLSIPECKAMEDTSRRLSTKDSSDHPAHRRPQVSSSWVRRTGVCSLVLTTVLWTHRRLNSLIHFSWCLPLSRNSVGDVSSPSWTCGAHITSFESHKAMNGRRPSLPLPATMNTFLCHMALPMPNPSSRNSWTRCSGSFFIPSWLSTSIHDIHDILIYSRNLADHPHHIKQVLRRLCQYHLYLKLEKCEFYHPTVQFLGYTISQEGIQMDQGKVTAIMEWPIPQSVKELQRFLGFANFYWRFIKDFSLHTAPLTSMLRGKPKPLSWNTSAHESFEELKTAFSMAPILHHSEPQVPFVAEEDASTTGVGAVLYQQFGEPPHLQPCSYYSRKLNPAEQNYDICNRELLAIKLGLEEWWHWLEGNIHPFSIITYHKNLQ